MGKLLERFAALSTGVRLGIGLVIAGLIGGGYFYLYYLPTSEELAKARAALAALEKKVDESRRTAAQLPQFKEDVARLNQELIVALAQLPEQKEIPALLAQVSRVGQESGLEILSFRFGAEQRQGLYAAIPVQMRAIGGFHQLVIFFDRVSRLPRIVTIGDVSLTEPKDVNGRMLLSASFNATTYRFLPDGGGPAAPGAKPGPAGKGKKLGQ